MDGDINGGQLKPDNPVNVLFFHIGKGYIISLEKAEPGIIIFKIEGIPHTRRHLVNKTENTFVAAGSVVAHQTVFKINAQILIVIFNVQFPLFPIRLADDHGHGRAVYMVLIVKNIFHFLTVNGQQQVSGF